jgi:hypothetical protein
LRIGGVQVVATVGGYTMVVSVFCLLAGLFISGRVAALAAREVRQHQRIRHDLPDAGGATGREFNAGPWRERRERTDHLRQFLADEISGQTIRRVLQQD